MTALEALESMTALVAEVRRLQVELERAKHDRNRAEMVAAIVARDKYLPIMEAEQLDAKRYRWLRSQAFRNIVNDIATVELHFVKRSFVDFDCAVDKAIAKSVKGNKL